MVTVILGKDVVSDTTRLERERVKGLQQAQLLVGDKDVGSFSHLDSEFLPNDLGIKNPLLAAVYLSFTYNLPLTLTPDAIWNMIMQGVSTHINLGQEKHSGETLTVQDNSLVRGSPDNNWGPDACLFQEYLIDSLRSTDSDASVSNPAHKGPASAAVNVKVPVPEGPASAAVNVKVPVPEGPASNVDAGVKEPGPRSKGDKGKNGVISDRQEKSERSTEILRGKKAVLSHKSVLQALKMSFSTTTRFSPEHVANAIVCMDAEKRYFNYRVITLFDAIPSGIPSIIITGKEEDWSSILDALDILEELGLPLWKDALDRILKHFVTALRTNESDDLEFWRGIFLKHDATGSGGVPKISGWIVSLFLYVGSGVVGKQNPVATGEPEVPLGPLDFRSGLCETPFVWDYHGVDIRMLFCAGLVGVVLSNKSVVPQLGWLVVEAGEDITHQTLKKVKKPK